MISTCMKGRTNTTSFKTCPKTFEQERVKRASSYVFAGLFPVEIDKRERQSDAQRCGFVRIGASFPRFERDHQVDESGGTFLLELFDQIRAENVLQELFECLIHGWNKLDI